MNLVISPSNSEWLYFAYIFCAIGIFIALAEFLRKKFNGSAEITRKLVHILTGILIFFAPSIFTSGIPAILLALAFIIVNYGAIKFGFLKGMHGTNRVSYGTVYYPLSFLILTVLFWDPAPFVISISILILGVGDAAAAIVGENLPKPHEYNLTSDKKSFEGSLTMFATTFIIMQFMLWYFDFEFNFFNALQICISVALFTTAWEAISSKGFDNLTVPLGASLLLFYYLVPAEHSELQQMFHGAVLGTGIAVISLYLRFLSPSGSIATFLLATPIYGVGGWKWTVPILVFFIASSLLSKFEKSDKKKFENIFDKTDRRDEGQVAANGALAGLLVIVWYIFPERTEIYFLYLATIAAVTADTWGTEIGILGKGKPVSIVTFKKVEPGTSGGVSLIGLIGSAGGAVVILLSAVAYEPGFISPILAGKIVIAAILASLADSILGATLQSQYMTADGKITEKVSYKGESTVLVKGYRWIDNDIVNWTCAMTGPILLYVML